MSAIPLPLLEPAWVRYATRVEPVTRVATGFDTGTPDGYAAWNAAGRPSEVVDAPAEYIEHVDGINEAQGLQFLCPACYANNGGKAGTHSITVTFEGRGALDSQGSRSSKGGPSRWIVVSGEGFDDLTLSPSIDCGCWHGHIQAGMCAP